MGIVKKIALSLLTAAVATVLIYSIVAMIVAINNASSIKENDRTNEYPFVTVSEGTDGVIGGGIMVDKETRVMYIRIQEGITVMLNADGSPKRWTGELPK